MKTNWPIGYIPRVRNIGDGTFIRKVCVHSVSHAELGARHGFIAESQYEQVVAQCNHIYQETLNIK